MCVDFDYKVVKSGRKTVALQIKNGDVIVRAPYAMSNSEIYRFVVEHSNWVKKNLSLIQKSREGIEQEDVLSDAEIEALAKEASEIFSRRVAHYASLLGVTYGRITVRMQKTRWGSCSAKGNLNFNCLLMLAPPEVLDSVVAHELCHRKFMDHSESFYLELLKVFPDYNSCKMWLKEHGDALMARGIRRVE